MVPEIVVTPARLAPLGRVRQALQEADARIPVETELMALVREALGMGGVDPMNRGFLEELASHKVAPMADPWDLAQVLYPSLCVPWGAPSARYEVESGLCSAVAELEDLFLQLHARRGMPALRMEPLRPPFREESHVVTRPDALDLLHRRFALACMDHPAEDDPRLPAWQRTRLALSRVLDATRAPGVGLLVYRG